MWQKFKLLVLVVMMVLLLVLTLQNTQETKLTLLSETFTMPQAAGLFLAAAVGFLGGALAMAYVMARRRMTGRGR